MAPCQTPIWPKLAPWLLAAAGAPGGGLRVVKEPGAELVRVRVEFRQHRLDAGAAFGPPVAGGREDECPEGVGEDTGPEVGGRVDALPPGEGTHEFVAVLVGVAQV